MLESRRHLLRAAFSYATLLAASSRLLGQAQPHPVVQPPPPHNLPNGNYPQGLDGPGPAAPDQKSIDRQNQQEIRAEIDKMFGLVSELKQELSVTNTASVLSLNFVKKAHELEKLAKHVKDLAKG